MILCAKIQIFFEFIAPKLWLKNLGPSSDDVTDVTSFYVVMEQPKINGLDELNNNLPDKGS